MDALGLIKERFEALRVGEAPICAECREEASGRLSSPLLPWSVGKKFSSDQYRLLFVGKTDRGLQGESIGGFRDRRDRAREHFLDKSWPFWSYTREIAEQLYELPADEAFEHVAMTNLVKCNDSDGADKTPDARVHRCVNELGAFMAELEIINPARVIFYTGEHRSYARAIDSLRPQSKYEDSSNYGLMGHRLLEGSRPVPWWERTFFDQSNTPTVFFLRTGHPQGKKKNVFVAAILDWIRRVG